VKNTNDTNNNNHGHGNISPAGLRLKWIAGSDSFYKEVCKLGG